MGPRVRLLLGLLVGGGAFIRTGRLLYVGLSTVAIDAGQLNRASGMHAARVGLAMARDTARALTFYVGGRLATGDHAARAGSFLRPQQEPTGEKAEASRHHNQHEAFKSGSGH